MYRWESLYHCRMAPNPMRRRAVWQSQGACDTNTDDYYLSDDRDSVAREVFETRQARLKRENDLLNKCSLCPVKQLCQEYALVHEEYGIWGGTTAKDRRRMRSRNKGQYDSLVRQAYWEGWLEPHALLPLEDRRELEAWTPTKKKYQKKQVAAEVATIYLPELDLDIAL